MKIEKRALPEKKMQSVKPKVACIKDTVKVLVEDGNLKILNV